MDKSRRIKKVPEYPVEKISEKSNLLKRGLSDLGIKSKVIKLTIGGKTKEKLIRKVESQTLISDQGSYLWFTERMINHKDFLILDKVKNIELVIVSVKELGFDNRPTTEQIYAKAQELGYKLCPAEVGPYLWLRYQYADQFRYSYTLIGMSYISIRQLGDETICPSIFCIRAGDDSQLELTGRGTASRWNSDDEFAFVYEK